MRISEVLHGNTSRMRLCVVLIWYLLLVLTKQTTAQTEGDTGYEYDDAYDDNDDDEVLGMEPKFQVAIQNVTVVEGQNAVLPCTIENLGKHKVAWVDPALIPLTYDDRTVTDDSRFIIERPYIKEWNLGINEVTWPDQGIYRCTINTDPPKNKIVNLHVKVPPKIIDELSSDDVRAREGEMVMLTCNVTGVPYPEVTWYRREADKDQAQREAIEGATGEMILIKNVTRHCDYIYECRASNGVEPDDIRRMKVTVEYPPEVMLTNAKLYQQVGKSTVLMCEVSAYPLAQVYWEKNGQSLHNTENHRLVLINDNRKTISLSLEITDLTEADFGWYTCSASNTLGKNSKYMELLEYKPKQTTPTPTPTVDIVVFRLSTTQPMSTTVKESLESKPPKPKVNPYEKSAAVYQGMGGPGSSCVQAASTFLLVCAMTLAFQCPHMLQ